MGRAAGRDIFLKLFVNACVRQAVTKRLTPNNVKHFAFKEAGEAYAYGVNNVHGVPGAGIPHGSSFNVINHQACAPESLM